MVRNIVVARNEDQACIQEKLADAYMCKSQVCCKLMLIIAVDKSCDEDFLNTFVIQIKHFPDQILK